MKHPIVVKKYSSEIVSNSRAGAKIAVVHRVISTTTVYDKMGDFNA